MVTPFEYTMWVEERTYQLLPGRIPEYWKLYESKGMPIQLKYLPRMLGYHSVEIGGLNEIVHLWGHDSLDAREANRARMRADPGFQAYWHEVRELIVRQQTRILRPAPFFAAALGRGARTGIGAPHISGDPADLLFTEARSHKHWLDRLVEPTVLREVYDLVKWGPTSMNCQPLRVRFVTSPAAKDRLLKAVAPGNLEKCRNAPVVAVLGYDLDFSQRLPELFPPVPEANRMYEEDPTLNEETAFRNANLQAGYFILAARLRGLDAGPISGFDHPEMDRLFWAGTRVRTTMLCMMGYGDHGEVKPRLKRLDFEDACTIE